MRRLKSIDTLRGLNIIMMIWLHLSGWWSSPEAAWLHLIITLFIRNIFWVQFQMISGISITIFFRKRKETLVSLNNANYYKIKYEIVFRGLILFTISLIFNVFVAFGLQDPSFVWSWFIILAISVSMILIWPLLKISKTYRLLIGLIIFVANFFLMFYLQEFQGQINPFGILYYILFNPIELHPILTSFGAYIIGSAIGDILFDIYSMKDDAERKNNLKNLLIFPSMVIGGILIAAYSLILFFPDLHFNYTFQMFSSLGLSILFITVFVVFEEYKIITIKNDHKFFFYFSYFSLTVYIFHHPLSLLFFEQLNVMWVVISILMTIVIFWVILRILYLKFGDKISIKGVMRMFASMIISKIEEERKSKNKSLKY